MSATSQRDPAREHDGSPHQAPARRAEASNGPRPRTARDESRQSFGQVGRIVTHPVAGASIVGAVVLGAASLFGVAEAVVGAGAAYGIYLVVNKRREQDR